MKLLQKYFKLQKEIYEYFGYEEDWVVIPLEDSTGMYWKILGGDKNGRVVFSDIKEEVNTDDGYSNEIYTQRFLPKYVYRGKDFTMVCVDTQTDGNKFLQVFDNSKEIK